jgi:aspartyl-tRNA(Asn)/glutamyl-tRNA(Gln) amidotransferase subunit A
MDPFTDIAGLHVAFGAGETTPAALAEAQLERIDRLNPRLNAFVDLDPEGAEQAAVESGTRFAAAAPRELEGVTIGIKSSIAVAGLPWTAGMELHRGRIAQHDAGVVARLRAAGAVVLGTLAMHEAALGATTDNRWFGRTFNPHGEGRTPGGSSGGSGAAVAAGLCVAALGTDTLGSVRIPAAYNGVYGLKPTRGALPDDGLEPLHREFDEIGPLARSVDDLEALWFALTGPPTTTAAPGRVLTLDGFGGVECQPAVLAGYAGALGALPGERATLSLPPLGAIRTAAFIESALALDEHLGEDRGSEFLSPELRWMLTFGRKAMRQTALVEEVAGAVREAVGEDGVLLLPTAPQAAFRQGSRPPTTQADFTALASIAGLPALSLPSGRDADGMPVAVQLVGPPGGESMLFDLARTLDAALAAYAPPSLED